MISSKKYVKKKDSIKYFKEIVEVDIKKQKIIVQWSMKQLSRKEKLEALICIVLNLEYFYHFNIHEI